MAIDETIQKMMRHAAQIAMIAAIRRTIPDAQGYQIGEAKSNRYDSVDGRMASRSVVRDSEDGYLASSVV